MYVCVQTGRQSTETEQILNIEVQLETNVSDVWETLEPSFSDVDT